MHSTGVVGRSSRRGLAWCSLAVRTYAVQNRILGDKEGQVAADPTCNCKQMDLRAPTRPGTTTPCPSLMPVSSAAAITIIEDAWCTYHPRLSHPGLLWQLRPNSSVVLLLAMRCVWPCGVYSVTTHVGEQVALWWQYI